VTARYRENGEAGEINPAGKAEFILCHRN